MIELVEFSVEPDNLIAEWKGDDIVGPVWDAVTGPLRPALFVEGSDRIELVAKVKTNVDIRSNEPVELYAASTTSGLKFHGSVSGRPGVHDVRMLRSAGRLDRGVKTVYLPLQWSFHAAEKPTVFRRTPGIKIFQVLAYHTSLFAPEDFALELALGYVNGAADPADAICRGIARQLFYSPEQAVPADPLNVYEEGRGDCENHAGAMRALCKAIGIRDVEKMFVWGGETGQRISYRYVRDGQSFRPSIQMRAPGTDGALENPHFRHHVQVRVEDRVFDPSYGTEGRAHIMETAELYTSVIFGTDEPSSTLNLEWRCPH